MVQADAVPKAAAAFSWGSPDIAAAACSGLGGLGAPITEAIPAGGNVGGNVGGNEGGNATMDMSIESMQHPAGWEVKVGTFVDVLDIYLKKETGKLGETWRKGEVVEIKLSQLSINGAPAQTVPSVRVNFLGWAADYDISIPISKWTERYVLPVTPALPYHTTSTPNYRTTAPPHHCTTTTTTCRLHYLICLRHGPKGPHTAFVTLL